MHTDKILWFNYNFKKLIIIKLLIINLTFCQCNLNETENVTKSFNDYWMTAEYIQESDPILLVESENENSNNSNSYNEITSLTALYESKLNNYRTIMKHDQVEILQQMQKVNEIFDSLSGILNTNETDVDVAQADRPKCTITRTKLEKLQLQIQNILSNVTNTNEGESNHKCTLNFDITDNCNNLMKTIHCGLNHIKHGFIDAMSNQGSVKAVSQWKNAYHELSKEFEKYKMNLNQSLTHEYKFKIAELKLEIQNVGKLLNTALDHLETNTFDLCVIEIVHGMISKAVDHFMELKYTSMSKMVKQAYNFHEAHSNPDEIQRVVNIDKFIQLLPENGKVDALKTFYKEMKAKNHLNSIRVLILQCTFENSQISDSEIKNELKMFIDPILFKFVDVLAFNRTDSQFHQFLGLNSGKYFSLYAKYTINEALEKQSLNETIRLKNILDRIRNFPSFNLVANGLSYVNDYIKKNNVEDLNVLKLACQLNYFRQKVWINSLTNQTDHKLIERLIKKFADIQLPINVISFAKFHSKQCKIRNVAYPEYISVVDSKYDERHRKVFLNSIDDIHEPDSVWTFETYNDCDFFMIKIVNYNEYLFIKGHTIPFPVETMHLIHHKEYNKGAVWIIEPRNEGKYFALKNIDKDRYLFADLHKLTHNRHVYAFKKQVSSHTVDEAGLWEIVCNN